MLWNLEYFILHMVQMRKMTSARLFWLPPKNQDENIIPLWNERIAARYSIDRVAVSLSSLKKII